MERRNRNRRATPRLATLVLALLMPYAALAAPRITLRPAAELPVELLRPADGEVLGVGTAVRMAWRATRNLEAEGIHEWEAFLSFDGGSVWPVRITPHLDIDSSSVEFVVPRIPSDDVRLMLRFGDEEREIGYVLPHRFRVAESHGGWRMPQAYRSEIGRGEAAEPGASGVVLWATGDRDGRNGHVSAATWQNDEIADARAIRPPLWLVLNAPPPTHPATSGLVAGRCPPQAGQDDTPHATPAAFPFALLSLLCRRNE